MPSENNWEPARISDPNLLVWRTIPGTNNQVNLQFMKGDAATIMTAVAADFNAYVEPLRDADSASYTATNSVATSNHLNGTAMDLNWNSHPFRVRGTFNSIKIAVIRELLAFYESMIFWAGDWDDPIDEMHWQMGYKTYQNPSKRADFIKRKIRSDGYSTFRRGGAVVTPTVAAYPSQEQMLREVWDKLRAYPLVPGVAGRWPSRAIFRDSNAGIDDSVGMILNTDANTWDVKVVLGALGGDPKSLALVQKVADGKGPDGNKADAVNYAKAIINLINKQGDSDDNA